MSNSETVRDLNELNKLILEDRSKPMPGEVSRSNPGPSDDSPYIPSWLYKNGPKMCPCGHHEGYHGDNGGCNQWRECGCTGIPENCRTPLSEAECDAGYACDHND